MVHARHALTHAATSSIQFTKEKQHMLQLLQSIRDKLTTALAYVRVAEHEDEQLEEGRKIADSQLDDAIDEIDEYLDSHKNN